MSLKNLLHFVSYQDLKTVTVGDNDTFLKSDMRDKSDAKFGTLSPGLVDKECHQNRSDPFSSCTLEVWASWKNLVNADDETLVPPPHWHTVTDFFILFNFNIWKKMKEKKKWKKMKK